MTPPTVMTQSAARILLLPILIIAFAVMIKGYADIGDGFSAGVIASLAIIMQGIAFGPGEFMTLPLVRYAPAGTFVGLLIALATAFVPPLFGKSLLEHSPAPGDRVVHFGSLELITAVVFDVGVFLIVFGFTVGICAAMARAIQLQEREQAREGELTGDERL